MECNILLPDEEGRNRPYACREVIQTSVEHYEKVLKPFCQVLEWDKKELKKVQKVIEPEPEIEEEKEPEKEEEKPKKIVPHNKQVITSKGKK